MKELLRVEWLESEVTYLGRRRTKQMRMKASRHFDCYCSTWVQVASPCPRRSFRLSWSPRPAGSFACVSSLARHGRHLVRATPALLSIRLMAPSLYAARLEPRFRPRICRRSSRYQGSTERPCRACDPAARVVLLLPLTPQRCWPSRCASWWESLRFGSSQYC